MPPAVSNRTRLDRGKCPAVNLTLKGQVREHVAEAGLRKGPCFSGSDPRFLPGALGSLKLHTCLCTARKFQEHGDRFVSFTQQKPTATHRGRCKCSVNIR